MRSFFNTTYYFWLVWRAILIVLGMISLISLISVGRLKNLEVLVNFSFFIYLILLTIIFVKEVRKAEQNRVIKTIVGVYSILFAIGLFIAITIMGNSKNPAMGFIGMLFSMWLFLLGLFDLLVMERKININ